MRHIIIFSLGLNLIVGTGIFLYTYQVYRKYVQRYLKALLYYIIFFNIMIFVAFIYEYLLANLFSSNFSDMLQYPVTIYMTFLLIAVFGTEFGITYSLYRIVTYLKEKEISRWVHRLFMIWVAGFGTGTMFGMLVAYQRSELGPFYWIHSGWIFSMIIIIISILISLLVFSSRNRVTKNSLKSFSHIFLIGYAGFTLSHLDFYFFHTGIEKYFDPLILLLINLCPFIWLKFYFTKKNLPSSTAERRENILNKLCRKYHISKREKEIIELILTGKSNKEIEDSLFISFNTVKNHIYNIYQKFGVQSRSQLIHYITRHYTDEE